MQKVTLIISIFAVIIGIPSFVTAGNNLGWFEENEKEVKPETNIDEPIIEEIPENTTIEPIKVSGGSENDILQAKVTNGEFGFQITLPDVDKWEFVRSNPLLKYTGTIMPNRDDTFRVKEKETIFFTGENIFEIVIFKPNEFTREENIKKIVQMYNRVNIHTIETEIESDISGVVYITDTCGLSSEDCKFRGWIQLVQTEDTLFVLHARTANDKTEPTPTDIPEDLKFMLESFRLI